jgi:hypothetical protein
MVVQSQYGRYPGIGYVGDLSRPEEPYRFIHPAVFHQVAAARAARPGDPVYYVAASNQFALPTDAATLLTVCGIVSFDPGTLPSTLAAIPSGANSDQFIEYKDDAIIKIGTMGTFYVVAGEALEYGDLVVWDVASFKWDKGARAANHAAIPNFPIQCVSRAPVAADGIAEVLIGSGRAI